MKAFFARIVFLFGLCVSSAADATAQPYTVTTIAGSAGVRGSADGSNVTASFYRPSGLALDAARNIYVADLYNHTIRKIAPAGTNWLVTTLAGQPGTLGSADGTNDHAQFNRPSSVAIDNAGNLFVTDNYNQTIRKITAVGTNWVVSTIAGLAGVKGSDDGTNSQARFNAPQAIALDGTGRLYVSDRINCTIRELSPSGTNWVVRTIAGTAVTLYGGFADGINGDAEFNLPFGIARQSSGDLYVSDFGNNAIRKISPIGADWVTTTVAGFSGATGTNDGPANQAMFNSPNGIAVDESETLYVTDQFGATIRRIQPAGNSWLVSTIAGFPGVAGSADGVGAAARFAWPWGIVEDRDGNFFVADAYNNTIRKLMPPPTLEMQLAANLIIVSWSAGANNYIMETTQTLGPGASWEALTNGVAVVGDKLVLTNAIGSGPAFFRLRSL